MTGMVDVTGQPRSDEELQEAIDCITLIMTKHATVLPMLTVNAMCIRNCLQELQQRRNQDARTR